MSKRFFDLFGAEFDNRWSYTSSATNATLTAQVGPNVKHGVEVHHLDFFHLTILNKNTLDFTMTPVIRDASAGGTVLAQWPLLLKGSQVAQVAPAGLHLVATKGKTFFLTTDTVQPSVTATVNGRAGLMLESLTRRTNKPHRRRAATNRGREVPGSGKDVKSASRQ